MNNLLIRRAIVDCDTAVSLYLKLRSLGASILLDSAQAHPQRGRYSFIGLTDGVALVPSLEAMADLMEAQVEIEQKPSNESMPPFLGGWVVARTPDGQFLVAEANIVVILDNYKSTLDIVTSLDQLAADDATRRRVEVSLDEVRNVALGSNGMSRGLLMQGPDDTVSDVSDESSWTFGYDPFEAYRLLRAIEASPYMAYVETSDYALAGLGAHSFVAVDGRTVTARQRAFAVEISDDSRTDESKVTEARNATWRDGTSLRSLSRLGERLMDTCSSLKITEHLELERHIDTTHAISALQGSLSEMATSLDVLVSVFDPAWRAPCEPMAMIGFVGREGRMDCCHLVDSVVVRGEIAELFSSAQSRETTIGRLVHAFESIPAPRGG
jgi:anthranilate/para-aminobenzoate synthase component I